MAHSRDIASHLPLLRRYARAITGTQKLGDGLLAAMLEAIVDDPSMLKANLSLRVALYQLFVQVDRPVTRTPLAQQAMLLVGLEGFPAEDAAAILEVGRTQIDGLLDQARRELALAPSTDILIVHRDTFVAMDLENILEGLGHRIVGIARTHADVLKVGRAKHPGLILTNTILADGGEGLDAVGELVAEHPAAVVVVTANPDRFLTGERPEPAFVCGNPFQPAGVAALVMQTLRFARKDGAASAGWR